MQNIDQRAIVEIGISGLELMEKAGLGVALAAKKMLGDSLSGKQVIILCGKGNNGGDGLVTGRYLHDWGAEVICFLLGKATELKNDTRANLVEARKDEVPVHEITEPSEINFQSHLIIDAIFGTGFQGKIEPDGSSLIGAVIKKANSSEIPILAIDIPSGLNADTGQAAGLCIKARKTVTLALPKRGHYLYPGRTLCGELEVVDIGIPDAAVAAEQIELELITPTMIKSILPPRPPDGHKGTFGKVLVVAGSVGLTGAAYLTALSALRSGCGMVLLACPKSLNDIFEIKLTEVMTRPMPEVRNKRVLSLRALGEILKLVDWADIVAIGPGLGTHHETQELVRRLLGKIQKPVVLDADGINALDKDARALKNRTLPTIISPHPGELMRLTKKTTEEINQDRLIAARATSKEFNAIVAIKGAPTFIAEPSGKAMLNPTGNSGMATAGSGDVLTGTIAGLLAQGMQPFAAAWCGVYLHGFAGDIAKEKFGEQGLIAGDIAESLAEALRRINL